VARKRQNEKGRHEVARLPSDLEGTVDSVAAKTMIAHNERATQVYGTVEQPFYFNRCIITL